MDFRHRIGSDPSCSDPRLWRFERDSGLPLDYFGRRGRIDWSAVGDRLVLVAALVVLVAVVCGFAT